MIRKKFDELRLTGKLPSPSPVGLRVLALTQDEDFSHEELTRTIMADPALSGRLIKLANAAANATRSAATTVSEAASRLGARALRNVALGFTLLSDNRTGECAGFDADLYWARSLAAALAAQAAALESASSLAADAFTCGLLADVGKLALASVHPAPYSKMFEDHPFVDDLTLSVLEQRAFDITHPQVSAAMLADWGLSGTFQEAVLEHEFGASNDDQEGSQAAVLRRLLRCGKRIADVVTGIDQVPEAVVRRRVLALDEVADELATSPEEVLALCVRVRASLVEWGVSLSIPTPGTDAITELVVQTRERVAADDEADGPKRELALPGADTSLDSLDDLPSLAPEATPAEPENAAPTRILIIDDDERMVRLIRHHLERESYVVSSAMSSDEGLEKALDEAPQIVITDWMMPGMSGVKLCETLRKTEAGRKMYVLMVTAREDDEQVVEAFAAGADDYIVKPFNPRILLARVRAGQRMIHMREMVEESERVQLRQVAELGILTRRLRSAALTDALTDLPNRRYAMARLKQEWENSFRSGWPLSVIMLDIDHFKRVNDVYGHDAGDGVLRQSAQTLRLNSRTGDVLCRLGGEEFLSINVGCGLERALVCAERMRAALESLRVDHPGFEEVVTVSLGVAERLPSMESVDDLLKAADDALFRAKESGRNRVIANEDDGGASRASGPAA